MFERFKQRYTVTSRLPAGAGGPILTCPLEDTPGYEEFMRQYAGATFNKGLYRVHTLEGRAMWNRLIGEAFPRFKGKFSAFGCDWMGRQFALDSLRREDGQPLVSLFDPGFGEVLEVPGTFQGFHDEVLLEMSDAVLADKVFEEWLQAGNRAPGPTECVGYDVPPFLGGVDEFENFGVTDMEVYWDITAQLMAQTRDLPEGTPIGKSTIE